MKIIENIGTDKTEDTNAHGSILHSSHTWKQPENASTDEWMSKIRQSCAGAHAVPQKDGALRLGAWAGLENTAPRVI